MSSTSISPFAEYQQLLLTYVNNRLTPVDWPYAEQLVRNTWTLALGTLHPATESGMEEGIPSWLAAAARQVIREYLAPYATPAPDAGVSEEFRNRVCGLPAVA